MKFLSSDSIVVALSATVITTFSSLFYYDINKKVDSGSAQQIGTVTYKNRVATRKYSDQVVWEKIEQNGPVYNNDTLRTADLAEVKIALNSGTVINLSENSMILLSMSENSLNVNFFSGSMSASSAAGRPEKISIKSGNSTVNLSGGSLKLSQDTGKKLNVTVNEGAASIDDGSGEKKIEKNQSAVVGDVIQIQTKRLFLNSPADNSIFSSQEDLYSLELSWQEFAKKDDEKIILQVSSSSSFEPLMLNKISGGFAEAFNATGGMHYWRIKSEKQGAPPEYSDWRKFTVVAEKPVVRIAPANNAVVYYRVELPVINFSWNGPESTREYRLKISGDPDFSSEIFSSVLPGTMISVNSLPQGEYYWKVDAVSMMTGIEKVIQGSAGRFRITQRELPPPPVMSYPTDGRAISRLFLNKKDIVFTWDRDQEIKETEIVISRDADFKNIVHASKSAVNYEKIPASVMQSLVPGTYYWKVSAEIEGRKIVPPLAFSFRVTAEETLNIVSPSENEIIYPEAKNKSALAVISWSRTGLDGSYHLEVATDREFANVYKKLVTATLSASIANVDSGRYYCRVVFFDNEGAKLLESGIRTFSVLPALSVPAVVFPARGTTVDMSNLDILELRWNLVNGADSYTAKLWNYTGSDKKLVLEESTPSIFYNVKNLNILDVGRFVLSVQAFGRDREGKMTRKSDISQSVFNISLGGGMEAVELNIPSIIEVE